VFLQWSAIPNVSRYHVDMTSQQHGNIARDFPPSATSTSLVSVHAEDTVCVRVSAYRGKDKATSDLRCTTTGEVPAGGGTPPPISSPPQTTPPAPSPLGAPTITSIDNSCSGNPVSCTITVNWAAVAGAAGYRLVADSSLDGHYEFNYPASQTSATQNDVSTGDYICIRMLALRGSEEASSGTQCVSTGIG
jgi:hypothetical protein